MPCVNRLVLALAMLWITSASTATPAPSGWQPEPGATWQWQLDTPDIDAIPDVAIIDLDGVDASRETVARLHDHGIRVICYVSVGTWEDWRPDAAAFPPELIGDLVEGWDGERYLDIRRLDLLGPLLEARFDACRDTGFDAIEPDNMDSWGADTGFPLDEDDALRFARWLADAAHARGLAIAQKNAPELATALVDRFDLAITEDCVADGWCEAMRPYLDAGKPVLAAEYTDRMDEATFDASLSRLDPARLLAAAQAPRARRLVPRLPLRTARHTVLTQTHPSRRGGFRGYPPGGRAAATRCIAARPSQDR